MNITLTITASDELMEVLKGFIKVSPAEKKTKVEKIKPAEEAKETPAPAAASTSTSSEPVTIEKVRAAVQEKAQAGKRDAVKKLLSEFGADKVTSLQKEQYSDFLAKVEAL
jgi:hypothetical protein